MGLRGLELQESAREIEEKLSQLGRLWGKAAEPFAKLGAHLTNTQKQYEEASRALDRFATRLEGIAEESDHRSIDSSVDRGPGAIGSAVDSEQSLPRLI